MIDGMPHRPVICLISMAMLGLAGCQTEQQRKAAENAAIKKQAATEVARICALHGAEREAALKRFREVSGMELYCPGQ
jgi:hypothetical protein